MSSRFVVAMAVLVLPLAVGAVSAPAQARGEVFRCEGQVATIVGTGIGDIIHGTEGPDVIVGLRGRDVIDGGGGDDLICGGTARDTIDGGAGNDRIHGNQNVDTLTGGDGDDHLFGNKGLQTVFTADQGDDTMFSRSANNRISYENAPSGVSVDLATGTATGWGTDRFPNETANVTFSGSLHDDTVLGTSGSDAIDGVQGNDTIDGLAGIDFLHASAGSLAGGEGDDFLSGRGTATLDLDGGPGDDSLFSANPGQQLGGPGDDRVSWQADGRAPALVAGLILDGGPGTDQLRLWDGLTFDMGSGSMSADSLTATGANFENFEGSRGDFSAGADYDITGTDGPNSIILIGSGSATVHALGGDDLIHGDEGDNLIDGGAGEDTADGRGGTDTCASVEHPSNCEVVNP